DSGCHSKPQLPDATTGQVWFGLRRTSSGFGAWRMNLTRLGQFEPCVRLALAYKAICDRSDTRCAGRSQKFQPAILVAELEVLKRNPRATTVRGDCRRRKFRRARRVRAELDRSRRARRNF